MQFPGIAVPVATEITPKFGASAYVSWLRLAVAGFGARHAPPRLDATAGPTEDAISVATVRGLRSPTSHVIAAVRRVAAATRVLWLAGYAYGDECACGRAGARGT